MISGSGGDGLVEVEAVEWGEAVLAIGLVDVWASEGGEAGGLADQALRWLLFGEMMVSHVFSVY